MSGSLKKLEKEIEKKVCQYAQKKGFLTPKINVVGERGWPDRLFIDPDGWHVYIEFKAPGKAPDPIQIYRQSELAKRNVMVLVVDDEEQGKSYVDDMVSARLSEESDKSPIISGSGGALPGPRSRED